MLNSIRDKTLALYAVLFLSVATMVTALSYLIMLDYLNNVQREKLETGARLLAENIKHRYIEKENLFKIVATGKAIEVFAVTYQEPMLAEYFSGFGNDFTSLSFVSYDGMEELKMESGVASRELLDMKGSALFQEAVMSPGEVLSAASQGGGKGPIMTFAHAELSYFDEPIGVVMGDAPLAHIMRDVKDYRFGKEGSALLIDDEGIILSHIEDSKLFKLISGGGGESEEIISRAAALKEGFGRATIEGVDGYVAVAPVEGRNWSVMVILPYEEFIAAPRALRNTVSMVFVGLIIVGLPAILYLVTGITRPLMRLVEATDAIAHGDLAQSVDIKSRDEVGMLGRSFNYMTEALRTSRENLEKTNESLRLLSAHMLSVREDERKSVAREVHDELGQLLSTLKLDLALLKKRLPAGSADLTEKAESMSGLIDMTIESVQKITSELRPLLLDDLGLAAAIEWQAGELSGRTAIECETDIPDKELMLEKNITDSLFRIYQEAMVNVVRHSGATKVQVSLKEEDGMLHMIIKDNGKGIESEELNSQTAFGLMGIRERVHLLGGIVGITGEQGKGTAISVKIPVKGLIKEKA